MALADKKALLSELSPPLDFFLATQLIDEFTSSERRFVLRDWEPAELDGGQISEICARILYHQDSGNLNLTKGVDECLRYVENDAVVHRVQPRHNALHLAVVIRTAYKFRSQRGAVHVSPSYSANELDAKLIIECCRWIFAETLRIFWRGERAEVARIIREICQFDAPCVGQFENVIMVQRTDLKAEEELLVLLHFAGDKGFSRNELDRHCLAARSTISDALTRLSSPSLRQVIRLASGNFRLTDLGQKRIRENLSEKLTL